ncbi:sensor histidine kinase [Chloroflexota bacterium]
MITRASEERYHKNDERLAMPQLEAMQTEKLAAIGKLVANVAHEVNNSLTVILIASSFALEQVAKEDSCRADLKTIREEALRLRHMTKNILNFARSRQEIVEVVEINLVVRSSVDFFRHQIAFLGVECQQDYTNKALKVLVDKNQMV